MRVLVMFDLPSISEEDRRQYAHFRKILIKDGFIMMQESVYCKLALNLQAANLVKAYVKKNRPTKGCVQLMIVTEKQYADIEYITGKPSATQISSTERIVVF